MLKSHISKAFAAVVHKKNQRWISKPIQSQKRVFSKLITDAKHTVFGKKHSFHDIKNHDDFVERVHIRDYEGFRDYIDLIKEGHKNVLWRGKPLYLAKTSGTTSGTKYIPISRDSIGFHIKAARDALLNYIHNTGNTSVIKGKMIFLQGSPVLTEDNGIEIGRLSGIVAHYVPEYLRSNKTPSWKVNCIEDWETKVDAIVKETINQNMTLIGGIPCWAQMYFEKLIQKSDKSDVSEILKNFSLFIHGGVNYAPYKNKIESLIGKPIDTIEVYPASEGFFAYQDRLNEEGLLLLVDSGIFYEFIRVDNLNRTNPPRITLEDVELNENYLMIISTNAGLWAYNLGDTVRFISKHPYRLVVTGRVEHFISAFGEHVIAKEVEQALHSALEVTETVVNEFTVAPQITPPEGGLPYHEWFIEFESPPENMDLLAESIDKYMQKQNIYYRDLIEGRVLQTLKIRHVKKGGFLAYTKTQGKIDAQNKVRRLANDRDIADNVCFRRHLS